MADVKLEKFRCNKCKRSRQGTPIKSKIWGMPVCVYCDKMPKFGRQPEEVKSGKQSKLDTKISLKDYLFTYNRQKGICSRCRKPHRTMRAIMYDHKPFVKKLTCSPCLQILDRKAKPKVKAIQDNALHMILSHVPAWQQVLIMQNINNVRKLAGEQNSPV